jgi:hypothetical protein
MMLPQLDYPGDIVIPLEPYVFRRDGDFWRIVYDGSGAFTIANIRGVQYIAYLLRHPNEDVDVITLEQAAEKAQPDFPIVPVTGDDAPELDVWEDSSQPVLDKQARDQYKARLNELAERRKEAGSSEKEEEELAKIDSETEMISRELGGATGLAGRARTFPNARERARVSVQKRVKAAIDRISEHNPELAKYLKDSIETGNKCIYRVSGGEIAWKF